MLLQTQHVTRNFLLRGRGAWHSGSGVRIALAKDTHSVELLHEVFLCKKQDAPHTALTLFRQEQNCDVTTHEEGGEAELEYMLAVSRQSGSTCQS